MKLTLKGVAQGILNNWDRLGCNTKKMECRYRYDDGTGCAIGVNIDEETIQKVLYKALNGCVLGNLTNLGIVEIEPSEEPALRQIQDMHDSACRLLGEARTAQIESLRQECEKIVR